MKTRIRLRPIEDADASRVQEHVSDGRIADTCSVPHPYPADGAATWTRKVTEERKRGQRYAFAILFGDQFAGVVDLELAGESEGTAELGYWVPVHLWDQGIATEACRQAIAFAFGEIGLSCLTSSCLVRNPASGRVLEKNGFQQTDVKTETDQESRFLGERWRLFRLTRERQE